MHATTLTVTKLPTAGFEKLCPAKRKKVIVALQVKLNVPQACMVTQILAVATEELGLDQYFTLCVERNHNQSAVMRSKYPFWRYFMQSRFSFPDHMRPLIG